MQQHNLDTATLEKRALDDKSTSAADRWQNDLGVVALECSERTFQFFYKWNPRLGALRLHQLAEVRRLRRHVGNHVVSFFHFDVC